MKDTVHTDIKTVKNLVAQKAVLQEENESLKAQVESLRRPSGTNFSQRDYEELLRAVCSDGGRVMTDHQAPVLRRKLRQGGTDKYRHDTAYYENVEG